MKFKSHLYYEEKDRLQENLKKLKPLPGSTITFFRNGVCLGSAFTDIYLVSSSEMLFHVLRGDSGHLLFSGRLLTRGGNIQKC